MPIQPRSFLSYSFFRILFSFSFPVFIQLLIFFHNRFWGLVVVWEGGGVVQGWW